MDESSGMSRAWCYRNKHNRYETRNGASRLRLSRDEGIVTLQENMNHRNVDGGKKIIKNIKRLIRMTKGSIIHTDLAHVTSSRWSCA